MPAEGVHLSALRDSLEHPSLSAACRHAVMGDFEAARLGALFVDFPYFAGFGFELVRYLSKRPSPASMWGDRFHRTRPMAVAAALLQGVRQSSDPRAALAFALGYVSHAAVDVTQHPTVNRLARALAAKDGSTAGQAHREVEKHQSILFHEQRFGADLMGTAQLGRYLSVRSGWLVDGPLAALHARALQAVHGEAPARAFWRDVAGGYRTYVAVLASPVGARILPEAGKRAGRPLFFEGPALDGQGIDFIPLYAASVERSAAEMQAAFELATAPSWDGPAFDARLPERNLDAGS